VRRCSERFGAQCIVVAIDASASHTESAPRWRSRARRAHATGIDALSGPRARRSWGPRVHAHQHGPGRHLDGYDLDLTRAVARSVVCRSSLGRRGTLQHLADGLTLGEADAVLAASIFHYGTHSIAEAKEYLAAGHTGAPAESTAGADGRTLPARDR